LRRRDGSIIDVHLKRGVVNPTLEVTITETPEFLKRRFDTTAGLALIDL
jgi:uncharacterized protein